MVKKLPANVGDIEMWVQSLGQEDPLRRAWQHTPVSLPGESHGQRTLVRLQSQGLHRVEHYLSNLAHTHSPFMRGASNTTTKDLGTHRLLFPNYNDRWIFCPYDKRGGCKINLVAVS